MTLSIRVPADGAYFAGHFPGRPILPGVALLDLVAAALARTPLAGIAFVRFRRTIAPGAVLELESRELPGDRLRVTVRSEGAVAMNGELVFGTPAPPRAAAPLSGALPECPALDSLLPHRPPMRFVTAVAREAADGADCIVAVPSDCGLAEDGTAAALAVLEGAAQTAAVWEALRRRRAAGATGAREGYLVAARDIVLRRARVPADAALVASVRLDGAAMPLAHYRASVAYGTEIVMEGAFSTVLA